MFINKFYKFKKIYFITFIYFFKIQYLIIELLKLRYYFIKNIQLNYIIFNINVINF